MRSPGQLSCCLHHSSCRKPNKLPPLPPVLFLAHFRGPLRTSALFRRGDAGPEWTAHNSRNATGADAPAIDQDGPALDPCATLQMFQIHLSAREASAIDNAAEAPCCGSLAPAGAEHACATAPTPCLRLQPTMNG